MVGCPSVDKPCGPFYSSRCVYIAEIEKPKGLANS